MIPFEQAVVTAIDHENSGGVKFTALLTYIFDGMLQGKIENPLPENVVHVPICDIMDPGELQNVSNWIVEYLEAYVRGSEEFEVLEYGMKLGGGGGGGGGGLIREKMFVYRPIKAKVV